MYFIPFVFPPFVFFTVRSFYPACYFSVHLSLFITQTISFLQVSAMSAADSAFLVTLTSCCLLCDLKCRKIPNLLIACGLLCGSARLFLRLFLWESSCGIFSCVPPAPGSCLLGFLLPYLLLGWLAMLKMLGGGDVKLISVIGLFTGAQGCFSIIIFSLFFGAVLSAFLIIRRKNLFFRLSCFRNYFTFLLKHHTIIPYRESASGGEFCFSIPIFCALVFCLCAGSIQAFL